MSILNTLTWWQWALLGAVPIAIVLLYFLKLKRQRLVVPSTYLWMRTVEDLHVNTIWQRLRRNLLLFLQLLLIALLMLALLRPGWRGTELTDERLILLLDNSASMSATDERPSRLEQAKQGALALVDQMTSGHVAMIISFSDTAQTQSYNASRRTLRRQIEAIAPTNHGTDIREALSAAAGLANPGLTRLAGNQAVNESLPATLYILSDGGFAAVPDFSLGNLTPVFLPSGQPTHDNLAIVALAADRNPEQPARMQAFVSVANFSDESATVVLELFLDDQSLDLVELTVSAREEAGWHFDLPDLEEGVLKVVLHHADALSLDNVAYTAINRPRLSRVLVVSPGNDALRTALDTGQIHEIAEVTLAEPAILADAVHREQVEAGMYDLIIYDRCQPTRLPQANTLFLGSLPPGDAWKAGPPGGPPTIIDMDRVHPLTQLVDMSDVRIADGRPLLPPIGSTVLFDSVIGPLLAIGPREGFEDAVCGFPLFVEENGESIPNSTWPLRPSFPVFVYNAVRYLGGSRGSLSIASLAPGSPITLRSPAHISEITVTSPSGQRQQLQRAGQTPFVYADTQELGVYAVSEGPDRQIVQRFAVNLFDPQESDLRPRPSLDLGHETVQSQAGSQPARKELWKWILGVGLVVLVLEWYIYNRRVFI
ncbi:MAG: VWA domain-containing protein [Pirellulaceae bacterium]